LPIAKPQLHGKRQKRTVSLNAPLRSKKIWPALDKIGNELLPRISDFKTPKFKKPSTSNYSLRLKQKFAPLLDFEELVSPSMYDTHKGIFLPISAHFSFKNSAGHQVSEHYLRMLRLPFNFYSKRKAPAFDDPAIFLQNF
jgi:ribosomal protein L5